MSVSSFFAMKNVLSWRKMSRRQLTTVSSAKYKTTMTVAAAATVEPAEAALLVANHQRVVDVRAVAPTKEPNHRHHRRLRRRRLLRTEIRRKTPLDLRKFFRVLRKNCGKISTIPAKAGHHFAKLRRLSKFPLTPLLLRIQQRLLL